MSMDEWQNRIEVLENKVSELESQQLLATKEAAYVYIHSNWSFIRWFLTREQDRSGEGSETYARAKNAERLIDAGLSRSLREIHFETQAMDVAHQWRIEVTVILTQNGYTFFD